MNTAVAFLALCVVAASAQEVAIPILKFNNELGERIGDYNFNFETANGIQQSEQGEQVPTSDTEGDFGAFKSGTVSYKTPEGQTVLITYKAGPNGYEPKLKIVA